MYAHAGFSFYITSLYITSLYITSLPLVEWQAKRWREDGRTRMRKVQDLKIASCVTYRSSYKMIIIYKVICYAARILIVSFLLAD